MRRIHRVGTITLGITLIAFGVAFLLHYALPMFSYSNVIRFWPVVFILLGVEVLGSNLLCKDQQIIYDKAGMAITACVVIFAMVMGCASFCMKI